MGLPWVLQARFPAVEGAIQLLVMDPNQGEESRLLELEVEAKLLYSFYSPRQWLLCQLGRW